MAAEQVTSSYDIEAVPVAGPSRHVDVQSLRTLVAAVLLGSGYPADRADLVADSLVHADRRGVGSHGVTRTRIYSRRARAGMVDPNAQPECSGPMAARMVDAHNAPGQVGADIATRTAIEVAGVYGISVVGVVNSNHCGTLAYFLERIAHAGLVGLAATNGPAVMAYFGGRTRAVGTNPLGYAIPRPDGPPIVLDMATSNAARGKIISMARSGEGQVPEGWAVDVEGRPTADPVAALEGAVLPFAGPKGSGLAMGIELLCGTMLSGITGPQVGDMYEQWDRPQRVGHVFIAVAPESFGSRAAFDDNVRRFVTEVGALPPAEGSSRVMLPGEREDIAGIAADRDGLLLSGAVIADLEALADELGLPDRLVRKDVSV
ncbi:Ldh family oxidoreductase [Mycobacterium sp. 21AC1]|uniref:Ldh family oxidoreductase n=1 Tax=[Mycobacterium] appelbergii TaxID=2939269 RepID=UPI00293940E7|nr:Ldh family oxidoreductase [Mycobacterium sp. 21AC1]MDV3125441.1 Ldh family oxidoreductase [Mycobacterium sp. 21AC1]